MLGFICFPCQEAGQPDVKNVVEKRYWHNKCKGSTWCDCQHRIGRKNVQ